MNGAGRWSPSGITCNAESRSSSRSSAAAGSSESPISASATASLALDVRVARLLELNSPFSLASHDPNARAWGEPHPPETPQVTRHDVPGRGPVDLGEARPARRLVAPGRLEGATGHADVANASADPLRRGAGIGQATKPDPVAALTDVRVGMEQAVGDVLHERVDLAPGHLAHPGVRIGHGRVSAHV